MARWILRFAQNDRARSWGCCLTIVVVAVAAYHNTLHGPFVFDDASSIVTNPTIRRLWPPGEVLAGPATNVTTQGRPILNLSLAINHALGGAAVEGYHGGNLIIHALAGLTLFGLVRRTLLCSRERQRVDGVCEPLAGARSHAESSALAIALLWTVHPLQTESVTYIIQRAESLVGLFYLLTLYCFVRGANCHLLDDKPPARLGWLTLAVGACFLGMATKEVMATAPLMVLFFDRTFFARTFLGALLQRRVFYAALAATWLVLAWLVAGTGGNRGGSVGFGVGVSWWDYALTQFKAIGHYLWLTVWPHPLVFEYGAFWIREFGEIAVQVAVVFALLAATIWALWRRSPLGFLGAWFFGILAPTSLAPGTTQMIVEHRMYLPLAAVIAFAVAAVQRGVAGKRRWPLGCVLGGAALALVLLTIRRNDDYRSDVALWSDTIAKAPNNPLAHFMLAGAQERAGNPVAAMASYERTLELKPDFSIGHENFGELLFRMGRRADAIAHFESALRLQPEFADAHANLGIAYLDENRIAEAVGHLEKAAQLMPESALRRYQFGYALAAAGLPGEAISEYQAALQRSPDMVEAHYNFGNAFAASGRPQDAIEHYEAALRARPDYAEAHHNLGSALFEIGRLEDAARHYEETLRLAPDFPNARENLERVRGRMGKR